MLNRIMVVMFEGAPANFATTQGEARELISRYPDEDADKLQVFAITGTVTAAPAADWTRTVAELWAKEFGFGFGASPAEYLTPFPAFVREHYADALIAQYEASHDPAFLPQFLRRSA